MFLGCAIALSRYHLAWTSLRIDRGSTWASTSSTSSGILTPTCKHVSKAFFWMKYEYESWFPTFNPSWNYQHNQWTMMNGYGRRSSWSRTRCVLLQRQITHCFICTTAPHAFGSWGRSYNFNIWTQSWVYEQGSITGWTSIWRRKVRGGAIQDLTSYQHWFELTYVKVRPRCSRQIVQRCSQNARSIINLQQKQSSSKVMMSMQWMPLLLKSLSSEHIIKVTQLDTCT